MRNPWLAGVIGLLVLSGCGADGADDGAADAASPVTVTVTETVTVTATPDPLVPLEPASAAAEPPPPLELEVYQDGCGVIRSGAAPGVTYDNLTWSVRDEGGFQVLGRVAENETRYRYFVPGRFTVVLEAFWDGAYRTVSNEVTIRC